jgi:hypothetical protein
MTLYSFDESNEMLKNAGVVQGLDTNAPYFPAANRVFNSLEDVFG